MRCGKEEKLWGIGLNIKVYGTLRTDKRFHFLMFGKKPYLTIMYPTGNSVEFYMLTGIHVLLLDLFEWLCGYTRVPVGKNYMYKRFM